MEPLALRLVLPPLVVIVASVAQRRLGDRLGGLLVGLPLTSGTFLVLLLPQHGPALLAEAAAGMLAGQIAVIVFALVYARLVRGGVAIALVGSIACWALAVCAGQLADAVVVAALVFVLIAAFALRTWPAVTNAPATQSCPPDGLELAGRVFLASALIITLTTGVELLGPQLAGLLSAAPLVALVIAPSTHRQRGAAAAQTMLHGVARGSVAAAVFALVVIVSIGTLGGAGLVVAAIACLATTATTSLVDQPQSA